MNMDGLEWAREKWSRPERFWLRCNEFLGARLSSHLIADHPEIGKHLQGLVPSEKITVIPYGADAVDVADADLLATYGCVPHEFGLCIARPEPENSILEIVRAFSQHRHGYPLLVLGKFMPDENAYHRRVMADASDEVVFPGAIYDKPTVLALRYFAKFYLHGHRVGGTNPSLVEALASASPIVARRNRFNEWVAGPRAKYFDTEEELADVLANLEGNQAELAVMRQASRERHARMFPLWRVHRDYERLLERFA
jgi:glycosyltransferase involved in cell wall biosynthesis